MIAAITTGLIAGMIHVWSGPDHLAAIAPLAVRQQRRSWIPGVRWGFGHSAGVAVVGLLSLWLRDLLPVDLLSSWGERLVGVMLFGIGLWGLQKTLKNKVHTHEHEHDGERHVHVHVHAHAAAHERPAAHRHTHAAFGIGILHGLAGSSHFLGVLPVLAFPTMVQAIGYLAAFAAGTVASMAIFSWFMGAMALKFGNRSALAYRRLMSACSIAAMVVGCFWLFTSFR
ncbi:MAG: High-affinity nickel transporter [Verrucomicrobiota bacterium]